MRFLQFFMKIFSKLSKILLSPGVPPPDPYEAGHTLNRPENVPEYATAWYREIIIFIGVSKKFWKSFLDLGGFNKASTACHWPRHFWPMKKPDILGEVLKNF